MDDRERTKRSAVSNPHDAAAASFADRVRSQFGDEIAELHVFGSTARGDAGGWPATSTSSSFSKTRPTTKRSVRPSGTSRTT